MCGCRGGSGGALGICGLTIGSTKRKASLPAHECMYTYHLGKIDKVVFHAQTRGFHTTARRICWSLLFLTPPLQHHALAFFAQLTILVSWLIVRQYKMRTNTVTTESWIDTKHSNIATHKARATQMSIKLANNHPYRFPFQPCQETQIRPIV